METLNGTYNLFLVALSFVISVFGSFTALRLAKQIPENAEDGRLTWLAFAAFAMGGGAIWSMHFIGMVAFDIGIPVSYDIPMTLLSLVVAVLVTGLGLWAASRGDAGLPSIMVGGLFMGLGVASMHYTGMMAMRMPARMTWDVTVVAISVVIAIVASIAALWLAIHTDKTWHMAASAVIMGVAVCGMHYTGMAACSFVLDESLIGQATLAISPDVLAYSIFLVSLVLLTIGLVSSQGDRNLQTLPLER